MAKRAQFTRQQLLEAAGEVFGEKGFEGASVREICARAGVALAAVNYHYHDKLQLYVAVVRHANALVHALPREFPPGMPPEEKLRRYIRQMLTNLLDPTRPAWSARIMAREMTDPTEACATIVDEFIRPRTEGLRAILLELLPEETPPAERFLIATSIAGQCLHHLCARPIVQRLAGEALYATFTVERLAEHITRFSLAALGYAPPLGDPRRDRKGATR